MKLQIIIALLLIGIQLSAQDTKNTIVLTGILAHYDQISKYESADVIRGYFHYPVDPGIEFLYSRNLNDKITLGAGISFQKGRISDFIINPYRFYYNEISIPLLINRNFELNTTNGLLITTGFYFGKTILYKAEFVGSLSEFYEFPDFKPEAYSYRSDDFFLDFYFGVGYTYTIVQNKTISAIPFIKYRLNEVWLNSFQKKLFYGIKFSYSINFKNKN